MAPHGETIPSSNNIRTKNLSKPPRLSNDSLKRTMSDISFDWMNKEDTIDESNLPPISEVENAKCECCGMSEEYTSEYINRVRKMYSGKWICGLCADAVKEEAEKNGGKNEEALSVHMNACSKFNKFGRAYPVLYQAEAMREMYKKSTKGIMRAKSISPRDRIIPKKGGITRTNSCIPAITKEMNDLNIAT
ncbi:uncharacterized protein LOC107760554 [Nicotiana tabacum]|uniref:Uncharacterized protein LOC107760554 n=1 Tax=Nicotiana tabacum TaxID=4097 RepID=A0A1S3X2Q7_TOBAC|nr:uncharacterized protein LOC104090551 [Nicotiana tomentosiformis]XP_016434106.1 PREDICTED: uncharacterized protein LOC107760554 [Nicotiana tabacum]